MLGFKQMAILLASSSGEIITGGGSRGYVVWDPNILKEGLV